MARERIKKGRGAYPSPCCGRRSEARRIDDLDRMVLACSICGREYALMRGQRWGQQRPVPPELRLVWSQEQP